MADSLRVGMVGAGFIGQLAHLMNYIEIDRCRVVALADFRPELRRRVCERYAIPHSYESHHELLADDKVGAVVVVTPRPYTAPVVLDCLEAGVHVLSEKPQAGTSEQADRLVESAARNRRTYVVGYMKRHDEGVQVALRLLQQLLTSGELGSVLFARAHCYMGDSYCRADGHVVTNEKAAYADSGWPTSPDWVPLEQRPAYAAFVNTYSHNTNLLRYLFGKSPQVDYANLNGDKGQLTVLDFGDFTATLETGRSSFRGWDEITEVFFADGRLTLRTPPALLRNVPASVELYRGSQIQQIVSPQSNWTWSFRRQAQAFVDNILDGTEPLSPGSDAIEDLRLIEDMWRAGAKRVQARSHER
jgi:predicted dehydrogenase